MIFETTYGLTIFFFWTLCKRLGAAVAVGKCRWAREALWGSATGSASGSAAGSAAGRESAAMAGSEGGSIKYWKLGKGVV